MLISRREFLVLSATFVAGCGSMNGSEAASPTALRVVNAGPARNYAGDGVYNAFREQGFFIVRQGDKLFALSAICTHRKCKLKAERDRTFYCPCHGSTFDPGGHVTKGPAKVDLPVYSISSNERGELLVTIRTPGH